VQYQCLHLEKGQISGKSLMNRVKFFFFAIFIIISISSCGLPQIETAPDSMVDDIQCGCQTLFPKHPVQMVHSLTSILPNGDIHVAIGVTTISPETETIHCAIMTIEGMVLFEAEYNQKISIHRSIPPFDSMEFARNIIEDIRLVLFKPAGALINAGRLTPDSDICRYKQPNGMTVDVITHQNGNWEIHQYNTYGKQIKTIKAYNTDTRDHGLSEENQNIPSLYEITAHGILGYSLKLALIDVQQNPL
jgi:hypothetical protein